MIKKKKGGECQFWRWQDVVDFSQYAQLGIDIACKRSYFKYMRLAIDSFLILLSEAF